MKFFRNNTVRRAITLITGLIFLNLSFVLTEINSFNIQKKNKQLFENLIKLARGINEEETDANGEIPCEKKDAKEVDLYLSGYINTASPQYSVLTTRYGHHSSNSPLSGVYNILIQPPEA